MSAPAIAATSGRRYWRSAGALLLGFLAVIILSLGTDQAMHALHVYPPWGQPMGDGLFLLAAAYRLVYGVAGSYITAWAAPDKPMMHALLGALIGIVLNAAATVATWNRAPAFGPHWYPVSLMVTALPCAWIGVRLYERRARHRC